MDGPRVALLLGTLALAAWASFGAGEARAEPGSSGRSGLPKGPARAVQLAEYAEAQSAHYAALERGPRGDPGLPETKSPKRAFFLSLMLPGAGQYYAGARESAKTFLVADALLWGVFAAFRTHQGWREADYVAHATLHAGTDPSGRSDQYLEDLGEYASAAQYNEYAAGIEGPSAVLYGGEADWEWDSEAPRQQYKGLRRSAWLAHTRTTYVIGGLALGRIVSAIHAARSVETKGQPKSKPQAGTQVRAASAGFGRPGFGLALVRTF